MYCLLPEDIILETYYQVKQSSWLMRKIKSHMTIRWDIVDANQDTICWQIDNEMAEDNIKTKYYKKLDI